MKARKIIVFFILILLQQVLCSQKIEMITNISHNHKVIDFGMYSNGLLIYENRLFVNAWGSVDEVMILEDGSLERLSFEESKLQRITVPIIVDERLYVYSMEHIGFKISVFDLSTTPMTFLTNVFYPYDTYDYQYYLNYVSDYIIISNGVSVVHKFHIPSLSFHDSLLNFATSRLVTHENNFISVWTNRDEEMQFIDYVLVVNDFDTATPEYPLGEMVQHIYMSQLERYSPQYLKVIDNKLFVTGRDFISVYDIGDMSNISIIFSIYENISDSFTDALIYDNILISTDLSNNLYFWDISNIEDIFLMNKSILDGSGNSHTLQIYNDVLYVNAYANVQIFDLLSDFKLIGTYGNAYSDVDFFYRDFVIENLRQSYPIRIYNVFDESFDTIKIYPDFLHGEYRVRDFDIKENLLYVVARVNYEYTYFDIYEMNNGDTELIFRAETIDNMRIINISGDYIIMTSTMFGNIPADTKNYVYRFVDNELIYYDMFSGNMSGNNGGNFSYEGYFAVVMTNHIEFRDTENPFHINHTRPKLSPFMNSLGFVADNTISSLINNGIRQYIILYIYDNDFSDFIMTDAIEVNYDENISFRNGFMTITSALSSGKSEFYQLDNGIPRYIGELDVNKAVHFTHLCPDEKKIVMHTFSSIHVYDFEYTEYVSTDDPVIPFVKTELLGNYPNPFNPETTIEFIIRNSEFGVRSYAPPMMNINNQSFLKYPDRDYGFVERGGDGGERVTIDIYNIRGQKVRSLLDGLFESGSHSVVWDGRDDSGRELGSGVYLYRMVAGEETSVRKMVLLK